MLAIVSSSKTGEQLDKEKQAVAQAAVKYVRSNMLLGLGTGSTANYFLSFLAERIRTAELKIERIAAAHNTLAWLLRHADQVREWMQFTTQVVTAEDRAAIAFDAPMEIADGEEAGVHPGEDEVGGGAGLPIAAE